MSVPTTLDGQKPHEKRSWTLCKTSLAYPFRICVSVLNQLTIHAVSLHDESEQKEGIANYISIIVNSERKMRGWPDEDKELVIKESGRNVRALLHV